jgi:hypothetical protein
METCTALDGIDLADEDVREEKEEAVEEEEADDAAPPLLPRRPASPTLTLEPIDDGIARRKHVEIETAAAASAAVNKTEMQVQRVQRDHEAVVLQRQHTDALRLLTEEETAPPSAPVTPTVLTVAPVPSMPQTSVWSPLRSPPLPSPPATTSHAASRF